MKKLFFLSLIFAAVVASAAPPFKALSFLANNPVPLTNNYPMLLTNNSTIYYNSANIGYVDASLNLRYSSSSNYTTPMFPGATNNVNAGAYTTNFINGFYIGNINSITYYSTNYTTNATSLLYPSPFQAVTVMPNNNGDPPYSAISVTANLDAAASTNQLTFTFVRMCDGVNMDLSTSNSFSFSFPLTGVTNSTYTTNLNSTFLSGAGKIALWKVTSANSTTNGVIDIGPVTMSSFAP